MTLTGVGHIKPHLQRALDLTLTTPLEQVCTYLDQTDRLWFNHYLTVYFLGCLVHESFVIYET